MLWLHRIVRSKDCTICAKIFGRSFIILSTLIFRLRSATAITHVRPFETGRTTGRTIDGAITKIRLIYDCVKYIVRSVVASHAIRRTTGRNVRQWLKGASIIHDCARPTATDRATVAWLWHCKTECDRLWSEIAATGFRTCQKPIWDWFWSQVCPRPPRLVARFICDALRFGCSTGRTKSQSGRKAVWPGPGQHHRSP